MQAAELQSPPPPASQASEPAVRGSRAAWLSALPLWPLAGLLVLLLANALFNPAFFELSIRDGRLFGTPVDILHRGALTAFLALGMTLVIASGGVDLSVGSVMALSGACASLLLTRFGCGFPAALAGALLLSAAAGAFNGALVAGLKIQPIVATLVLMVAGRGAAMLLTEGQIVAVQDPAFVFLGNGCVLGVPFTIAQLAVLLLVFGVVLRRTGAGLFLEAAGGNETAARYCGVRAGAVKLAVYTVCGLCAGWAGLVATANIQAADSSRVGELMELDAIFAVVAGGTALSGGRFALLGSVTGALIIQTLTTTMYNFGVPSNVAPVPKALVVLAVCLLQSERVRSAVRARFSRRRAA